MSALLAPVTSFPSLSVVGRLPPPATRYAIASRRRNRRGIVLAGDRWEGHGHGVLVNDGAIGKRRSATPGVQDRLTDGLQDSLQQGYPSTWPQRPSPRSQLPDRNKSQDVDGDDPGEAHVLIRFVSLEFAGRQRRGGTTVLGVRAPRPGSG